MDSTIKKIKFKFLSLSFSLKVALAFSFFTVIFAAFVLFVLFYYIENHTIDLILERTKDYGKTAFYFSNKNDFENLKALKEAVELKWKEDIKKNPEILKEIQNIPPGETLEILRRRRTSKIIQ